MFLSGKPGQGLKGVHFSFFFFILSNFNYSSFKLETTQKSVSSRVGVDIVVQLLYGIQLSNKNEQITNVGINMSINIWFTKESDAKVYSASTYVEFKNRQDYR